MEATEDLQRHFFNVLDTIGKYKTEQKKTSIHITNGRAFIGLHPKKSYLGVNIVLNRAKAFPAADKVEQVSANRFHHFYKITSTNEINKSFVSLLKDAYELTQAKNKMVK